SPDQGANGIPMNSVEVKDRRLIIRMQQMMMTYEGNLSEDAKTIKGTFKQGRIEIPMDLTRAKMEKQTNWRPQDPRDFPYNQEGIKFKNKAAEINLAGTLTTPKNGKFDKVVVLISGSGPQNRDSEVMQFNHRPFLVLSDYLTRNGIAVLRYDERGVAESEGDFSGVTSRILADDVNAAVDYLKGRKDMKRKKIGLVGHSEGGMIAPIVASENKNVDFIASLAGPGIDIVELMLLQNEKTSLDEGVSKEIVEGNIKCLRPIYEFIRDNPKMEKEELTPNLERMFQDGLKHFPESVREEMGDWDEMAEGTIKTLTRNWFLYFMRHKPSEYISKVKCPVLAINGEFDLQVTAKENLEGFRKILKKAKNKNVTIQEIPKQNHLFQNTQTGSISEYKTIEETFNEGTMGIIADWIKNHDK
ncbi:MAG: alpha/beta hydrolase family protein, partial [Saprospiraceae bacterium]